MPDEDKAPAYVVSPPELPSLRVRKTLGQGGFGAVFLADRVPSGEAVAIKVARADNLAAGHALLREADAMAAIGVPHVPAIHQRGTLGDGAAFVVMELVRAPILADRLAALEGPMDLEEFARHALAILTVIEAAHAGGFVHCDLKPENVFVDPEFGAKLFDFGLVRQVGLNPAPTESTREEAPAGTPEYMSPEQCEGRTDIDARSDLYALGVMFYEMLAGRPPFWGASAEVQQNHRSRRPAPLSRHLKLAPALEDAIMRCLAKSPDRRFATATELRKALAAGLAAERDRRQALADPEGAPRPPTPAAVAGAAEPAAGKPAAQARERRAVALLFLESKSDVGAIREAGNTVGGQLAHTAGKQFVLAFGHEVGDNPTRSAAKAGEMLVARGLAKNVLVDLASVSVQARPDGTRRYQSPHFAKKAQYPGDADPPGVLLSPSAIEVLPDVDSEPVASRPGVARILQAAAAAERTTTRMGLSPLVGRDALLRTLLEAAREATSQSRPTITTLTGEPGFGKTHLAQMLVQHLEVLPQMQTLFVRAKEVLGGAGDQTTREILQRVLSLPDAAPADLGRALLAEKLGSDLGREVWIGVAVAMGWASPEHPDVRALAAAPGALRSTAARAVGEALRLLAKNRPLALIVEDAHFVDETALDAIEYATLAEAAAPIWTCVVGRPSFGQGRSGWAGRAAERQTITLPPLDPAAAGSLARRLLAPVENIPSSALARLAERTMGVPLLLVELCRGLKRDGVVRRSENGAWFLATDELERLPDLPLVQWLSSRETESLPPDLLAHARLASVLGVEFSSDEVEGVLQELERAGAHAETQLDAGIGLRRLSDSGLLTQHRGGRVGFRHSLLRDTVYQSVPPPEREAIHRAAYEYFRRQDRLPDEARMPQMAFHASKSGLAVEAGRLYLTLAGRASARHAYLDAELLYHSALENLPANDVPSRIAVEQGLGLMRFRTGRHDDALKDFSAALDLAGQIDARSARINILLDKALVLDWTMDWPGSRALSEEAAALVAADPSLATPGISPRVLMAQGRILYRSNHYAEGAAAFRQTVDAASQVGDEGYEAYTQSLSMLAFCTSMIGLYDEAREALRRGMEVVEQHGDMVGLAGLLQNRVILSFLTNDVELMLADLERIIQISREYGFLMSECMAVRDLAEVNFILGRTEEALSNVHRAIEAYSQQVGSSRRIVFNAEVLRARIMSYRGDAAGAEEIVRRVIARQAEAVASGLTEAVLTDGERVLLDALDLSLRSAPDADFDALAARGRELQLQPQEVVEIMEWKGIAALRSGRRAEGLQFLEEALAEANRTAKLAADRVRGQIAQALAATEPSPAVGSAQR